ncbi:MAG: pyrroline-5-carboxylate reductase [Planctomycetota bacterium]|jgi:pyrroline-5-carboxylate reductase
MIENLLAGKKIGFIGAGNMAEAIVRSLLAADYSAAEISFSDPSEERSAVFSSLGLMKAEGNVKLCNNSDIILLAVKPQIAEDVMAGISSIDPGKTVISIMMGVTTTLMEKMLPQGTRVVRTMPNTPITVGCGVTAVAGGVSAAEADVALTLDLFRLGGVAEEVSEEMMHAVTALSGSGPAYLFRFTELLAEAAEKLGLPAEVSEDFAVKTVVGSARLLEDSGESAEELRKKVTSPGGTTEAALNSFAENGFSEIIFKALKAAENRSRT